MALKYGKLQNVQIKALLIQKDKIVETDRLTDYLRQNWSIGILVLTTKKKFRNELATTHR